MKKLTFFLSSLIMFIALGSCSDSGDEPAPEFKAAVEALTFLRTAATQDLYVSSSVAPTASTDASWITLSQPALNGDSKSTYKISVSVPESDVYDDREGHVTISAGGNSAVVKVTQRNAEGVMLASGFSMPEIKGEGESVEIPVLSTGGYTAAASDPWIQIQEAPVRSLSDSKVYIKVMSNPSPAAREGKLTLTLNSDKDGSLALVIPVKQAASTLAGDCDETAFRTAANIGMAINIGNTLEAIGGETAWGAAPINAAYIQGIRDAGFDAVRLPVSWYNHCDKNTLEIDAKWMDRVEEVVQLCVSNGLYVFMNIHWDEGWMEKNIDKYEPEVDRIQRRLWEQIAPRFNYFDKHLVLCGANESGKDTQNSADALKAYMQTFIDVVRATGGNNANRVLVVQSPGTDINLAVKYCADNMPTDKVADRLMLEVHCYDPSDYTIMESDGAWGNDSYVRYFWGKDYHVGGDVGKRRDCTWGEEDHIDAQMRKMKTNFVDKGIPVILGEYSCGKRNTYFEKVDEARARASRNYYHKFLTRSAKNNGLVPFLWDTPESLFNRASGIVIDPDNLSAIREGADEGKYPF